MRDNNDFVGELRDEIVAGQSRRHSHVRAKVIFLISLLGIGTTDPGSFTATTPLLYLTTLVVFVFDLYILGENFGVKRAGAFIMHSPSAPSEERRWENAVRANRDPFAPAANLLSSLAALAAAAIALWLKGDRGILFGCWIVSNIAVVVIVAIVDGRIGKKLKRFEGFLESYEA